MSLNAAEVASRPAAAVARPLGAVRLQALPPVANGATSQGGNALLARLAAEDYARLVDGLEAVPMRLGDMLYEPGVPVRHAYFPGTAVVSLHHVTASGASVQTTGVGLEGVVGLPLYMGGASTCSSATVHTSGHGWRMDRHRLALEFSRGNTLQRELLRYTQALMTQVAQTAACYRHHSVEQQLSSWLLTTLDRRPQGELVMTQELLGSLLGVRRESITQAASALQQRGYIRYRRGHIAVTDAGGLVNCACECYGVVRKTLLRLSASTSVR
jgi:CRP-like cAMP-binding protein